MNEAVNISPTEAVLSDMDGTLLNTEVVKEDIFREAKKIAEAATKIHSPLESLVHGASVTNSLEAWLNELDSQNPEYDKRKAFVEEFLTHWRETQDSMYRDPAKVIPFEDTHSFVAQLNPMQSALVSSNPEERLQEALNTIGWHERFNTVIGYDSEGVKAKKPDPSSYTEAARRLGFAAENCWVPEDSLSGLQSAVSAGVKGVLLIDRENHLHQIPELQQFVTSNGAKVQVITSLEAITVEC